MALIPILIALLGLLLAVLVNYLADALPATRRFSRPACPHCDTPFATTDYLLIRNCRQCGRGRSKRSFAVLLLGIPASLYVWFSASKLGFLLGIIFLAYLALVLVIDLEHRAVLHETSYFGAALGLLAGTYLWSIPQGKPLILGLTTSLLGGAAGFLIMYALYWLGELFSRRLVRRRARQVYASAESSGAGEEVKVQTDEEEPVALGFGDVNLTGILGLVLGWPAILIGLFFGILASGLAAIVIILYSLITRKYSAFTAIPYTPFLIFGAVLLLYR